MLLHCGKKGKEKDKSLKIKVISRRKSERKISE